MKQKQNKKSGFLNRRKKIEKEKIKKDKILKTVKEENRGIEEEKIKKVRIAIVGVGNGGINIISEISGKIKNVSFFAINTDSKSLKGAGKKAKKILIGENLFKGLGSGMSVSQVKEAIKEDKEKIKSQISGFDVCLFVVSLGGGTGSGSLAELAKISKENNSLTFGIFTLPFHFEGELREKNALQAIAESKNYFNAIFVLPNDRIFNLIEKEAPLKQALSSINKFLSSNLQKLVEIIFEPALINIDFADLKTVSAGFGKLAFFNIVEDGKKEGREILEKIMNPPLFPYDLSGAKGVLIHFDSKGGVSLEKVSEISKAISEKANLEAKIIFGFSEHKNLNKEKIFVLAIGCNGIKNFLPEREGKKTTKEKKSANKKLAKNGKIKKEDELKKKRA